MKYNSLFLTLSLLTFFTGCGVENEESGVAEYEKESYTANQSNSCYDYEENSAGCFGDSQYFGDGKITDGIWSIYTTSNNDLEYEDKYIQGYQFFSDGTLKQRIDTRDYYYSFSDVWGVDEAGMVLTIYPTTSYAITASREAKGCYTVSSSDKTYRMCQELLIDLNSSKNSSGYYGTDLKFGNNEAYGNYMVVGEWSIDGVAITLDENGTSSSGGEWGVSQDGKMLTIDGVSYLVSTYPDNGCIKTYEMRGDYAVEPRTLCKID